MKKQQPEAGERRESLFSLTEEMKEFDDLLSREDFDATGFEQEIVSYFEDLSSRMEDKVDAYIALIAHREAMAEMRNKRAQALAFLAHSDEAAAERLRKGLYDSMKRLGKRKFETLEHKLWIQNNGGKLPVILHPSVKGPNDVDSVFHRIKTEIDLDAIRAALENDRSFLKERAAQVAELGERGEHLRIA